MDKDVEFKVKKVLREETDWIINEIEKVIITEDAKKFLTGKLFRNGRPEKAPGKTQFQMLMNASIKTPTVRTLMLLIKYQSSKDGGWGVHYHHNSNKTLAQDIIGSFETVLKSIANKIKSILGDNIYVQNEKVIEKKIAESYFGYLYWEVCVLCNKEK